MWLITNFGFFSIVQKPDDPRYRNVDRPGEGQEGPGEFRAHYLPDLGPIQEHTGTDYRYRAKAPRNSVAVAMLQAVRDIDYGNFKSSVAQRQSGKRSHLYEDVWHTLHQLSEEGELHVTGGEETGATLVAANTSYGGVLFDNYGHILLREPTGHVEGYHWTFAKGQPQGPRESAGAVALREVLRRTGYYAEILGRVPGSFQGGMGQNVYFVMRPSGVPVEPDPSKTQAVRWVSPSDARTLIAETTNSIGRSRDQKVLEAALFLHQRTG